jgi:hypothetical protein
MLKRIRFFLCGGLLLALYLSGCVSTHTIVTYQGDKLSEKNIAILEIKNNLTLSSEMPRVNVKAIDGQDVDNANNSKWNNNLGPASIELLPGNHSLIIEYFQPKTSNLSPGGGTIRKTISEGIVTFTSEPGHKYELEVDRRTLDIDVLSCTIMDMTSDGTIIFPQILKSLPFKLSEIPKDKAVVCFYWPRNLANASGTIFVSESNQDIAKLPNGSLFYHISSPGFHTYSISFRGLDPSARRSVDLKPGEVTYLSITGLLSLKLNIVQDSEALKEIGKIEGTK